MGAKKSARARKFHLKTMMSGTEIIAKEIRKSIVAMHQIGPSVGSALSIADILAVLYFDVMNIAAYDDPDRDRFILSKGHAVSALYATLAEKGFIKKDILSNYLRKGGTLYGHPVRGSVSGIEASTGSLGHGLPIGIGIAWAAKNDMKNYKVFVLMGDGECQEGSVWEGAMIASRLKLNNIIAIIDANNLQGYEKVSNIQPIDTFKKKWEAFGWNVVEVDGHNVAELKKVLQNLTLNINKPTVLIAHTTKGKGIAEMEGKLDWHYYSVPKEKVSLFIEELEGKK